MMIRHLVYTCSSRHALELWVIHVHIWEMGRGKTSSGRGPGSGSGAQPPITGLGGVIGGEPPAAGAGEVGQEAGNERVDPPGLRFPSAAEHDVTQCGTCSRVNCVPEHVSA